MQQMQHYKDSAGGLHALTLEQVAEGFEARLPEGCTKITDEEVARIRAEQAASIDPQSEINANARYYLASTDWYVIRQQETGQAIPEDVLSLRQEARERVK